MPKDKSTAGPMRTQPIERASIIATPVLPMMPTAGKVKKAPQAKQKPTRTDDVLAVKPKITRRNSLRKQGEALQGQVRELISRSKARRYDSPSTVKR
jgi:hypothetical protein